MPLTTYKRCVVNIVPPGAVGNNISQSDHPMTSRRAPFAASMGRLEKVRACLGRPRATNCCRGIRHTCTPDLPPHLWPSRGVPSSRPHCRSAGTLSPPSGGLQTLRIHSPIIRKLTRGTATTATTAGCGGSEIRPQTARGKPAPSC